MEDQEITKQINLSREYAVNFINKCEKKGISPQFCCIGGFIELILMSLCTCPDEKHIHTALEKSWEIAREICKEYDEEK